MPTDTMMLEAMHTATQRQDMAGLKLSPCQQRISRTLLSKITKKADKRISIRKTSAVGMTTMQVKG